MTSTVNITAIMIANAMGLIILFVVAIGNVWKTKRKARVNRCLGIMFLSSAMNCIADPACFLADGKAGLFNRVLVIGFNSLLYLGGMLIAYAWIYLVTSYLKVKLSSAHSTFLKVVFIAVVLMLIVNLFIPILFTADSNNVYSRLPGYWLYSACYIGFMLDGLAVYLLERRESGGLKFFPAWAFIIPSGLGILIQIIFYGISTATPFTTVSIACVVLCQQNESMFRDKITGVFNRIYLNTIEEKLNNFPKLKYSAIMLDINHLKDINDAYGHMVGDNALVSLAGILSESVGRIGEVIRYADDDFLIVMNTQDDKRIEEVTTRVSKAIDEFNMKANKPFRLSVSMGTRKLNIKEETMDEFIREIVKLMYAGRLKL